jgi:hypothetical protein
MVIVLTVAAFVCEAPANVERASEKPTAEDMAYSRYFITARVSENSSGEARQGVLGLVEIPSSAEGILFLSKAFASKRFSREKEVESAVADQELSIAANAPTGVFSKPKVTSLIIRLFSAHIAVRK